MKRLFRRLFYRFGKGRYYHNNYQKPSWKDINDLDAKIYEVKSQINDLADSLDRKKVSGVYMPAKEAKKYERQNGFVCRR
jgi:hypothetical protein